MTDPATPQTVLLTMAPFDAVTPQGAVTGAWMLGQLDMAAGLAGRAASGGAALILSLKEVTFHAPLQAGERFAVRSQLTRKGNTSFNLSLSAEAGEPGETRKILSSEVVMVAVDAAGKPRKLL